MTVWGVFKCAAWSRDHTSEFFVAQYDKAIPQFTGSNQSMPATKPENVCLTKSSI